MYKLLYTDKFTVHNKINYTIKMKYDFNFYFMITIFSIKSF